MKYEVYLFEQGREVSGQPIDWMLLGCLERNYVVEKGDMLLLEEAVQGEVTIEYPHLNSQLFYRVDRILEVPDEETLKILIVKPS